MMNGLILLLVFCAFGMFFLALLPSLYLAVRHFLLKRLVSRHLWEQPPKQDTMSSVLIKTLINWKNIRLADFSIIQRHSRFLKKAGIDKTKTKMLLKGLWICGACLMGLPMGLLLVGVPASWKASWLWWGVLLLGIVIVMMPFLWLMMRAQKRMTVITCVFPHFLDMMAMALESGLSEESAMEWILQKGFALPPLFLKELHRIPNRKRISTDGAFIWEHCYDLPVVRSYVTMMEQRMRMGVSIADGLRTLAREQRQHQLAQEETRAETLELKVIPIILLCMAPPIFVMVLFPVMVRLKSLFANDLAFPFL